jgi:hypothetical protein
MQVAPDAPWLPQPPVLIGNRSKYTNLTPTFEQLRHDSLAMSKLQVLYAKIIYNILQLLKGSAATYNWIPERCPSTCRA